MIIYKWYSRLFLACAILSTCLSVSGLSAASIPAHPSPVAIDISSLRTFLDTLPPDEKDEQLRDWAAYGLKSRFAVSTAEEVPIRHPALKDTSPGEVSKGRVFPISTKEWAVLLSKDLLGNKPLIGGLIDRKYAENNSLPEKISLFSYDCTPTSSSIDITFEETVNAADLFTSAYGYATATVSTLSDLRKFLEHVDDIVMVQWHSDSLVLGGRSYGQDVRRSVTIEEIAAVYQAYNIPGNQEMYEAFIRDRYADLLRLNGSVPNPPAAGSVEEGDLLAKIRRQFPHPKNAQGDAMIGFSLDLDLDYGAFADDIEEFARTSPLLQAKDSAVASASELAAIAGRIRTRKDQRPLIYLFRRLAAAGGETDMGIYSALYSIQQYHTYQMARYDGNLQGTQAGMMLFYTDLLAKLWAMDHDGISAGIGIKGFRPMTEIAIPKLYWRGYGRVANTRLWFGLKQDGYEVYGNKALFQPIATRVYAASSDLVTPGKEEGAPNFQSKEFLGWWDRHYEAFADYEPGYHTLNQIQKWSCIFMMLKVNGLHHMDFLLNVPVKRDIDFEVWSKNNDRLKTKFSVPFMDKQKYGHQTECLPLLRSKPHPFLGGYGMISGGITLATQKDIQAKLQKNDPPALPTGRAVPDGFGMNPMMPMGFGYAQKGPNAPVNSGASPQQAGASLPQKGRVVVEAQPADMPRTPGNVHVSEVPAKVGGADGTGGKQASIRLSWEKSPSLEAINFVNALAALQQSNARANKGEAIFRGNPDIQSVVRIKEWDTYLVKTSAIKDMWIYLRVNPSNAAEYPAVAAGSFADADIFCARLVSAADAQKLANGKQVIR
ncbi:MAG: hypothetical protein NDI77_06240 [Geobacteraceae bacterium]|nr:hypothetical protein [Geobacteraceae bacterium]